MLQMYGQSSGVPISNNLDNFCPRKIYRYYKACLCQYYVVPHYRRIRHLHILRSFKYWRGKTLINHTLGFLCDLVWVKPHALPAAGYCCWYSTLLPRLLPRTPPPCHWLSSYPTTPTYIHMPNYRIVREMSLQSRWSQKSLRSLSLTVVMSSPRRWASRGCVSP